MTTDKRDIILQGDHICKNFGAVQAVKDVSIAFERGKMHCVIGPNGAGKTTLIDLIINRTPKTSGKVFLEGKDITDVKPYKLVDMGVCKCFQIISLFPNLTVLENVQISLIKKYGQSYSFHGMNKDYRFDETASILEMVGMKGHMHETAAFLSYGDQKRLEIAISLAMEPKILFLDEPVAGVARAEGYKIMELIRKLNQEKGITVIFVEHDMDIIFNYSDVISVLSHGELVATDTPQSIRNNAFVQSAYLGGAAE